MKQERQFTEEDKKVFEWHSEGHCDWRYALGGTICLYDGRTGNNLHLVKATINEQCEIEDEEPREWISIEDDLPTIGQTVLCYNGSSVVPAVLKEITFTNGVKEVKDTIWAVRSYGSAKNKLFPNESWMGITHWMALPESP